MIIFSLKNYIVYKNSLLNLISNRVISTKFLIIFYNGQKSHDILASNINTSEYIGKIYSINYVDTFFAEL
jgi:hypothetical protein